MEVRAHGHIMSHIRNLHYNFVKATSDNDFRACKMVHFLGATMSPSST